MTNVWRPVQLVGEDRLGHAVFRQVRMPLEPDALYDKEGLVDTLLAPRESAAESQ